MKRVLQVSLALNLVLLAMAGWRARPKPSFAPLTERREGESAETASNRGARSSLAIARTKSAWAGIDAADPAQFIANLRAVGCPEQTLREIVTLRISRQFHDRLLAAETDAARSWDYSHNRNQEFWDQRSELQQKLRNEMNATVESLLGDVSGSVISSLVNMPQAREDWTQTLSPDKRRQLRDVTTRYGQMLAKLDREALESRGEDADILYRIRELEKQKQSELATFLSPQERDEWFYHQSAAALYARQNCPEARSEAEFRAMVRLVDETGMVRTPLSLNPAFTSGEPENAARREYDQLKASFDQRLKELLGSQRLTDQQAADAARTDRQQNQQRDQDDQRVRDRMVETAAAAGVSADSANRFWDRVKELKPALDARFEEMEKKLTGTPEEKQKQMKAAARAELGKIAVEIMGEKGRAVVDKMIELDP